MIDLSQFFRQDRPRIEAMLIGGEKLGSIREALKAFTVVGTTFEQIEAKSQELIAKAGCKPSFSTVRDYQWATCIMKNDALCHGIPMGGVVNDGDVITIDVGLIYQGYHNDTTTTFAVGEVPESTRQFLQRGQQALANAINVVRAGVSVYEISQEMEAGAHRYGYGVVEELTGHGVGTRLHEEPNIPCVAYRRDKNVHLDKGKTVAIEIMYTAGSPVLKVDSDHWTYRTADGALSGMFEDTVLVTQTGYEILTKPSASGIL